MAMTCSSCNVEISPDDRFCGECGAPVTAQSDQAAEPASPAATRDKNPEPAAAAPDANLSGMLSSAHPFVLKLIVAVPATIAGFLADGITGGDIGYFIGGPVAAFVAWALMNWLDQHATPDSFAPVIRSISIVGIGWALLVLLAMSLGLHIRLLQGAFITPLLCGVAIAAALHFLMPNKA